MHEENILRMVMSDSAELQTHMDELQQQHNYVLLIDRLVAARHRELPPQRLWQRRQRRTVPRICTDFVQHTQPRNTATMNPRHKSYSARPQVPYAARPQVSYAERPHVTGAQVAEGDSW